MTDRCIDIVLVDKSPLVLDGLRLIFERDDRFLVKATATDGEKFIALVDKVFMDVAVIGWDMPSLNGRGVLDRLKKQNPKPKVIVYTGNQSPDIPRQVMQLGGAGFCMKTDPPERLVETAVAVAGGRMVFPFMDVTRKSDDPFASLTGREQEMLGLLSKGQTNAQIAKNMGISLNTVKFHLKNLYEKMQVSNRAEAVSRYLRAGGMGS